MKSVSRLAAAMSLFFLVLPCLAAQDEQTDQAPAQELPSIDPGANDSAFKKGDALFSLQLGASLPLFFWNPNTQAVENAHLWPGGILSIRYMGFVATGIALGGELGASYNVSIANRNFFMVPLSFEAMWIGSKMPFEFPVGLGAGVVIDKLADYIHVDPFLKPQVGIYYRASPSWSFGLQASYLWVPQFYPDASNNRFGNFMTVGLSVFNHL